MRGQEWRWWARAIPRSGGGLSVQPGRQGLADHPRTEPGCRHVALLVDRIAARPNIEVLTQTAVTALEGQDGILEAIRCRSHRSGVEVRRAIRHLFLFIGAEPNTAWLSRSGVTLDDRAS